MAKFKCLVCGNPADSPYCWRHKPRKALKRTRIKHSVTSQVVEKRKADSKEMRDFFFIIWNERPHVCQSCGKRLGKEPRTYMFDHILSKSKYPELKYEKLNIILVCGDCHSKKTNGFPTDVHQLAIDNAKIIFDK